MPANAQISHSKFQISRSSLIIFLICLHLLIVLPLAYVLNIWADEASTLHTTQLGFSHALQHALVDEKQAPLYFWFLSLWREISGSIFFARLFSVACSCCAVKVFGDLARRVFERRTAAAATIFFAVHPYLIWASLEIRVYALVILLSLLLLKSIDTLYFDRRNCAAKTLLSSKNLFSSAAFVFLAVVALYVNYYLGFVLVGGFAALVVCRKWSAAGVYLLQMLVAGIAFAPLIWQMKSQFAANTSGFQADKSLVEGLRILWNMLLTFILPTEIFTGGDASTVSVLRLWLVRLGILAAIFLLIKNRRRLSENILIFGTISAVVIGFLFAAYYLLGGDYVGVRHTAILFASFALFLFSILDEIAKPKKIDEETNVTEKSKQFTTAPRRAVSIFSLSMIFTVAALFFFAYSIYSLYPNLTKRGDWAQIAVYLENNEKPNQPIIIFTTFDALALPYYYHGANRILPDERFFDFELEAETGSAESWREQTNFIISEIPPDAPEIWLLNDDKCAVKDSCAPLENFVQSNYTVIEEKEFNSETVRLLRKK